MRSTTFLAPLLFAATSLSQAVEEGIAPSSPPPSGCQLNADGNFTIGTLKVGHKLKRETAAEAADGALTCTLKSGILRDRDQRTGSVVANHQFQFDGPPQAGALYTGGFSICANGSLAIGGTTRWWQCSSGGFYNLYDEWIGAQCEEIRIQATFPQKPVTSSSAAQVAASSSVPVASVASSLATISGAVSTVSKSAIGPSASFTASPTAVPTNVSSLVGSATRSAASGASSAAAGGASSAAPAPPAAGAAMSSFGLSQTSVFGAFCVVLGAALML